MSLKQIVTPQQLPHIHELIDRSEKFLNAIREAQIYYLEPEDDGLRLLNEIDTLQDLCYAARESLREIIIAIHAAWHENYTPSERVAAMSTAAKRNPPPTVDDLLV